MLRRKALALAALVVNLWPASARSETKVSLSDALALARRHRSEVAEAELDVRLARFERLRAGLRRVRTNVAGRWAEQVEKRYANPPAELCTSIDGLCRPMARARVIDLSASVEVPIWTGFGLEAEWSRARQLERAARAQQRSQLRTLNVEVANAYWTVRWSELLRDSAARALARRAEVAAVIKARFESGLAPRTDYGRAESASLRQRAALAEEEGRVAAARADLAAALQIDDQIVLIDDPPVEDVALPPLAEALAEARRRRPELEVAAAKVEAQAQQVRAIKGALWPELSLFARADAQNEALGDRQPTLLGNFSAGIQVSWLALDGLVTWQAARVAEVEREKLSLDQQRTRHLVDADVRRAHARLASALAQRAPLLQARTLAEGTVSLIKRRYQVGAALLIELLDAEDELADLDAAVVGKAVEIAEGQAALAAARGEL